MRIGMGLKDEGRERDYCICNLLSSVLSMTQSIISPIVLC